MEASSATESWRKSLTPEMRKKIAALHKMTFWTYGKIPVLLGIWAICALIAIKVEPLWAKVPCWAMMGFVYHALGVFMHEGAHHAIFRNAWIDRPLGFLCGMVIFFPCSSYRATHLLHHQYENTMQDPDNLEASFPNKFLRTLIYWSFFIVGMPMYITQVTFTGPFRARGVRDTILAIIEPLAIAGLYFGLFTLAAKYAFGDLLINGWAMGIPFAILVANFRGLAEHTQLWHRDPPNPLKSTRTLKSNAFIRFFFNNQNHHLEHHLFPGAPWDSLDKIHDLLVDVYRKHDAAVVPGYLDWFRDAARWGPNRTISYQDARPVLDPPR